MLMKINSRFICSYILEIVLINGALIEVKVTFICIPECVPEDLSNPRAATQGDVMAAAGKQRSGTGNQPGEQ